MNPHRQSGLVSAFAAYAFWGVAPVYFLWVAFAAPEEVLAHRLVWATVLLVPAMVLLGHGPTFRNLARRDVGWLTLSAFLLSGNWLMFIWALFNDRMVETSLGYYLNPLMTVFLGVVFLRERPRIGQWVAIIIAAGAMVHEI